MTDTSYYDIGDKLVRMVKNNIFNLIWGHLLARDFESILSEVSDSSVKKAKTWTKPVTLALSI